MSKILMTTKLKGAIIGLGKQSEDDHIPGILDSRFAQLVAVCDVDSTKVEQWSKNFNIQGYTCPSKMFNQEQLDFVIIAVPHDQYPEIIRIAVDHKIHIFKEKPFARNLQEGLYLKNLCEQNNVVLMTATQRRFNPIYCSFSLLQDLIGEIYLINASYTLYVPNPHEGWRGSNQRAGGGCILDMGYHMIDTIIWLTGLPDSVYAISSANAKPEEFYDAEDTALITFKYQTGINGSLLLSRHYAPKKEVISFVGTNGSIEIQKGCIQRLSRDGKPIDVLTRDGAWKSASTCQIDYFCRVIQGQAYNYGSPENHLLHLSFIEACYISQKENQVINPKELLNHHDYCKQSSVEWNSKNGHSRTATLRLA
jgi:predicted dehydrogenase